MHESLESYKAVVLKEIIIIRRYVNKAPMIQTDSSKL
jgi:hypothetical protein